MTKGIWIPPNMELSDGYALQALERGTAEPEQQQRALKYIVEQLCMAYQDTYHADPREEGRNQGRRWAGLAILQVLHLNLMEVAKIREGNKDKK